MEAGKSKKEYPDIFKMFLRTGFRYLFRYADMPTVYFTHAEIKSKIKASKNKQHMEEKKMDKFEKIQNAVQMGAVSSRQDIPVYGHLCTYAAVVAGITQKELKRILKLSVLVIKGWMYLRTRCSL